jgi:hypothetical protein
MSSGLFLKGRAAAFARKNAAHGAMRRRQTGRSRRKIDEK